MADSKELFVQLWMNCFKSREIKSQKFGRKLKERINIKIVLTVGVFSRSKKISYCNAFGIVHPKKFILKHLFLFLPTV